MDPDEALKILRERMTTLEIDALGGNPGVIEIAGDVIEAFRNLDTWLARGGYAPDWTRPWPANPDS